MASNWIPRPTSFRPIFPPSLITNYKVADLIGSDHQWNNILIEQHFAKEDAEVIKNIPLPRYPKNDERVWHYDKKGLYTVKSGYQVALKLKYVEAPTSSTGHSHGWHNIWKLNLPRKTRIFIWRAAKDLLPTAESLFRRKIIQEPICQVCKSGVEDAFHAFMECKVARKVWKYSYLASEMQGVVREDILSVMQNLIKKMPMRR